MNFKTFFKCFSISFIVVLLYKLASLYSYYSSLCNELIPDLNGNMVRSAAPACQGNWFMNFLARDFGSFLISILILTLVVALLFYFISRLRQKAQIASGERIFARSFRPSVIKVISTILLSVFSYYGLLMIGFGFGEISPVVSIIAVSILDLPGMILRSFGISANQYAAMVMHVVWIYFLVCFVAYLITLKKLKKVNAIPSVSAPRMPY